MENWKFPLSLRCDYSTRIVELSSRICEDAGKI